MSKNSPETPIIRASIVAEALGAALGGGIEARGKPEQKIITQCYPPALENAQNKTRDQAYRAIESAGIKLPPMTRTGARGK